ncbi:hypothetical protein [Nocardiopsis changdeensis]|uniref:hypothetical protein n=1 Tax=Nocardiopsis changdeensis TaxID=2831969 RepID=UPI003F4593EC
MNGSLARGPAADIDALWFAWAGADGVLRTARFDTAEPLIRRTGAVCDAVVPGHGPGRFLVVHEGAVRPWAAATGEEGPPVVLPEGTDRLMEVPGGPDAGTPHLLAAAPGALLCHDSGGWRVLEEPDAPVIALAWQFRRHRALAFTAAGAVHGYDPASGLPEPFSPPSRDRYRTALYDEILGGVWALPEDRPDRAHFLRVEPGPPERVYDVALPAAAVGLGVSHSGEWLIVTARDGTPSAWLYNVNGARSFPAPPAMAVSAWPGAFTFDNHLVAVCDDEVQTVEIPARADVRAPGTALDIEVFWEARPRMHRASRVSGP